jgi:hypothetical protein
VVFLHPQPFQLVLHVGFHVEWAEVSAEMTDKGGVVIRPVDDRIGIHECWLEVVESHSSEVGKGEADLLGVVAKSVWSVAKGELELNEEGLEFFWIGTVKKVGYSEFGFVVIPSWLLKVSGKEGDGLREIGELRRLISAVVSAWGTAWWAAWRTTWMATWRAAGGAAWRTTGGRRRVRIAIVVAATVVVTTTVVGIVGIVVALDFVDVTLWRIFAGGAGKGVVGSDFRRDNLCPSNG